jgi:hypothetical protein
MTFPTSKLFVPIFAIVLMLGGCVVATGRSDITDADVNQFVEGKSTYQEVLQKLGKPNSDRKQKIVQNGKDLSMHYVIYDMSTSETKVSATSFIPVVGSLMGTTQVKSTSKRYTFLFDINTGILKTKSILDLGESNSKSEGLLGGVTTDGQTTKTMDFVTGGDTNPTTRTIGK